jgi:hypothetical protein
VHLEQKIAEKFVQSSGIASCAGRGIMMAEWQSAETLHPGASREAAIKMAGGLSIMSNMDDFKAGKISVWAETKADAERFLAELARKGFKKASGLHIDIGELAARQYSYVCNFYDNGGISRAGSDRYWYSRQNIPGKPYTSITVAEFFGKPKRNEQIVAYYNPDETVTCIHKKDGKVVQSATVKRYYKDADDLRVATEHALGKMLVEQKQTKPETLEYHPGDRVLVRDELADFRQYVSALFIPEMRGLCGKVVTLDKKGHDSRWALRD